MPYNVELPDGRSVEFPDNFSREKAAEVIATQFNFKPPERSAVQSVTDPLLSLGAGVGLSLQIPGQVATLAGATNVGSALAKPGEAVTDYFKSLQSLGLKAREAARSRALSEAEKEGVLSEFTTAIKQTLTDPALLSTFVFETLPQLVGPQAAASITRKLGMAAVEKAAEGAAKTAAKSALEKRATAAAVGAGAGMQGVDVGSDTYKEALDLLKKQYPDMPPEERERIALSKARVAALEAGAISVAAGKLPGASALEKRMAGVPGAGRLKTAAGESLGEMVEEGASKFASNIGLQDIDPTRSLTQGVGTAAGLGAIGGGTMGGLLGGRAAETGAPRDLGQAPADSPINAALAAKATGEAPAPATQGLLSVDDLFTLASGKYGYGEVTKYRESLLQQKKTPEVKAAIKDANDLLRLMTIEGVSRQREAEQLRPNERGLPTPETSAFNETVQNTETPVETLTTPKVRKKGAKNAAVATTVAPGEIEPNVAVGAGPTVASVGVDSGTDGSTAAPRSKPAGVGVSKPATEDGNAPQGITGAAVELEGIPYTVVAATDTMLSMRGADGSTKYVMRKSKFGKQIDAQLGIETPAEPAVEAPAEPVAEQPAEVPVEPPAETPPVEATQQKPAATSYEPPLKEGLTPELEAKLRAQYATEKDGVKQLEATRDAAEERLQVAQFTGDEAAQTAAATELEAANKAFNKAAKQAEKTYWKLYDEDKADFEGKIGEAYIAELRAERQARNKAVTATPKQQGKYPYNLTSLDVVQDELQYQLGHYPEYKKYVEKYFEPATQGNQPRVLRNAGSEKAAIEEGQKLLEKFGIYNIKALEKAMPTSKEFVEQVNKGQTRKALQVLLRDEGTHPLVKLVVQRMLKADTLPKLQVVPADSLGVDPENPSRYRAGVYNAVSDTVLLDERGVDAHNLVHEVMHGFMHRKIVDHETGVRTDAQVKRIEDLFKFLQQNYPDLAEEYGMTSLTEFTSEAMSNTEFQNQLKAIPYKKTSFFSEFARAVLKFLGINDTVKSWNALAEAMIATESAMQTGRALQEVRTGTAMRGQDTPAVISTPGAIAATAQVGVIGDTVKPSTWDNISRVMGRKFNRAHVVDKLVSIDKKLTAGYAGRLYDALGNINPSELLAQALDAPRVTERSLVEGSLEVTPDGLFTAAKGRLANGEEASLKRIAEIIQQSAKQTNRSFDEENKVLSGLIVGHREFELDKYNSQPGNLVPIELRVKDPIKRNELERQFQANPSAKKVLEIMDAMRFNRIDMLVKAGRITEEKAAFWKSTSGYVPYQDLDALHDKLNTRKTGSAKGLSSTAKYMHIRGSDTQLGNVFESFTDLISRMTMDAVKVNAVGKASETLVLLGHAKRINPAVTLTQEEKQHTVDTFIRGAPARFFFDDPLDAAAFAGMPGEISTVVSGLQQFSRVLRAGVTLGPKFAVGQVFQDTFRAYALSDVANPAALIPRILLNFIPAAYRQATGRKSAMDIRMENMGVMATFDVSTQGTIQNIMEEVGAKKRGLAGQILHIAEAISKGSDITVRQAIYAQSMKETGDEALSMSRAREIINFSRRGNSKTVDFLVRTVPFTNAYIRGMDKLYTAATGKSNAYGMTPAQAREMFRNRVLTLGGIGLVYAMMMAGDDEYESLDDNIRDTHFIIPGVKLGDTPVGIPLPRDLAFVFKAIPERLVNYMRKYGTPEEQQGIRVVGELMKQGIGVIAAPNVTPSALVPILETITGYSFFLGRSLESQSQRNLDPSLAYGRGTSELSKALSENLTGVAKKLSDVGLDTMGNAIKLSPIKLDNLFRGLLGTSAGLLLSLTDGLLAPERTATPLHKSLIADLSGISAVLVDSVGKKQLNDLYELHDKLKEVRASYAKWEELNPDKAIEYGRVRIPELEAYDYVHTMFEQVQERNKFIREIDLNKDLTPEQRMRLIADVVREQNTMSKDVDMVKRFLAKQRQEQ